MKTVKPLDKTIQIRHANILDAKTMAVLAIQVWINTYATEGIESKFADYVLKKFSESSMAHQIAASDLLVMLAEQPNLIGLGVVKKNCVTQFCDVEHQAELDKLYVHEPFCRGGVGTCLLTRIEQELTELGFGALWLKVWVKNTRANAFYVKNGYTDVATAWFELDGLQYENRVLVKTLMNGIK